MKWWGWGAEDKRIPLSHFPKFPAYFKKKLGRETRIIKEAVKLDDIELPQVTISEHFLQAISIFLKPGQINQEKLCRVQRAYGKSFRDLWRARHGIFKRAPDCIIFPESEAQIENLVRCAAQYDVLLIPFGGGSNIVGATEVTEQETRMVVIVDLERMNKVLEVDAYSGVARIQAGAKGPELERQLNEQGMTLGHFPDSFEYSTLGGWIATRSVGMSSDKYGTIDDMTVGVHCITTHGLVDIQPSPHRSIGMDLSQCILGSEGKIGIITEATMKVKPLPKQKQFFAVIFPSFEAGFNAVYQCSHLNNRAVMMRLLDAYETDFSFHLKTKKPFLKAQLERLFKLFIAKVKKINFSSCSIAIVALEGEAKAIKTTKKQLLKVCKQQGGVYLGQSIGQQWYARKYDYPYLRDLVMDFGCVVDVAETSVLWKHALSLYKNVQTAGFAAIADSVPADLKKLDPAGYIGCHLSHHYDVGTCLYFTFAFIASGEDDLADYWRVKSAMTNAIIASQGSLSHHHSVGVEHRPWLQQASGEAAATIGQKIKQSFDPAKIFND